MANMDKYRHCLAEARINAALLMELIKPDAETMDAASLAAAVGSASMTHDALTRAFQARFMLKETGDAGPRR
jgi:hypothetical protein